jgi:hypothetical protein
MPDKDLIQKILAMEQIFKKAIDFEDWRLRITGL